jgi:hypothetical protein
LEASLGQSLGKPLALEGTVSQTVMSLATTASAQWPSE